MTECACLLCAVDRRWSAIEHTGYEPRTKLGGGNGECRIMNLTSAAGGEGILDSQQWLRPIPKAGPDQEEGEKKHN